jgi:hypothetical protein
MPVVAGRAQRSSVLRIVGIQAGGHQFTASARVVVGSDSRPTAHTAHPVVALEHSGAEVFAMVLPVAAFTGVAADPIDLPARLREARLAFAVRDDLAPAPARSG